MKWHQYPNDENRLSLLNPVLCKEWSDKNEHSPSIYAARSGKKVWWMCSICGNEWLAEIRSRNNGRGCPRCSQGIHVSKFEMRVYSEIKQHFGDAIHGKKVNGIEIDVLIPSRSIGVEVDGHHWHQNIERDFKKNERLGNMGITIIRLREDLPPINNMDIVYSRNDDKNIVLGRLLEKLGVDKILKGEDEYRKIMVDFRRVSTDKMLSKTHPELCLEWSEKNHPLTTNHISKGSMDIVWWTCRFGHSWQARIDSRVSGNGCPICAGHIGRTVSDTELSKEWSNNNLIGAEKVLATSRKKYWWYCDKHNYHYEMCPHTRYYGGGRCFLCSGIKPDKASSLASNALIVSRWDDTKNGSLRPDDLKLGSGKRIWLRTKEGNSRQFIAREVVCRKTEL